MMTETDMKVPEEVKLSSNQVNQIMQGIYHRGDRIMAIFLLCHAVLAVLLASFYDTWFVTLSVGTCAIALFFVCRALMPRTFLTRCMAGISLQILVILHIYQLHGLTELHFFFFTTMTMMIVYQDWRCLWPGALLLIGQHVIFALMTNAGSQLHFFEDDYIGLTKMIFHFGIALAQVCICSGWAFMLCRRTLQEVGVARMEVEADLLRQSLARAERRAERDPLTDLINHRAFHRQLEEDINCARQNTTCLAVIVLDLSNFKFFNDAYGHLVGDAVLRQVAERLGDICRPGDTLARFGGDEFVLLAPGRDPKDERDLNRRIHAQISACGYMPEGSEVTIPLEASIGMAFYPQDGQTRVEILEMADRRLRRVKSGADEGECEIDRLRTHLTQSVSGFSMLDALVTAVDNKDRYTARHSEDVLIYSHEIGRALGLNDTELQTLKIAAMLHDVGKIGVPDAILRKPGSLTDEEYAAIQHHAMMGSVIVGAVPGFEGTLDAVRHHHERWDGGGYPFGLQGLEIPQPARIMAVADAFSAMTTDRPYRKGMPHSKALAILESGAGTQWDACCVEAFLRVRRPEISLPLAA